MKTLLIAVVMTLAACSSAHPGTPGPAPTTPTPCPLDDRSSDCVWPDGQPK